MVYINKLYIYWGLPHLAIPIITNHLGVIPKYSKSSSEDSEAAALLMRLRVRVPWFTGHTLRESKDNMWSLGNPRPWNILNSRYSSIFIYRFYDQEKTQQIFPARWIPARLCLQSDGDQQEEAQLPDMSEPLWPSQCGTPPKAPPRDWNSTQRENHIFNVWHCWHSCSRMSIPDFVFGDWHSRWRQLKLHLPLNHMVFQHFPVLHSHHVGKLSKKIEGYSCSSKWSLFFGPFSHRKGFTNQSPFSISMKNKYYI